MPSGRSTFQRLRDGFTSLAYGSPLYSLMLAGPAPNALAVIPPDPWPGDSEAGERLLEGEAHFAGLSLSLDPADPAMWLPPGATKRWVDVLHGFDWLRDLRAAAGDDGRRLARALIDSWITAHAGWDPIAWEPAIMGRRVANWIGLHDFYCASADDDFRARVFDSLARQTRHLARVLPGRADGVDQLVALKGLTYSAICLGGRVRDADDVIRLLERELAEQVLADGCHVSRSPEIQLEALRHLIDVRAVLRAARSDVPDSLQLAIDRMTPALRFFRHGDGGLACFNGAVEGDAAGLDIVLAQADARGRQLRHAPHGGFERLSSARTVLLMDTGAPAATGRDHAAHAGALSMELSVGKERLIVNCGAHPSQVGPWRKALAATAAHSTVTIADTNSSEVLAEGGIGRRPTLVLCEREDVEEGAVLVTASHDGYARAFGLIHRRRVYFAESGDDIRGEDAVEPVLGGDPAPHPFAVRFHLHPSVRVTVAQGGDTAFLVPPSGAAWRLRVSGGMLDVQESVYLGQGEEPRRTHQVVILGTSGVTPVTVKWALRRDRKV